MFGQGRAGSEPRVPVVDDSRESIAARPTKNGNPGWTLMVVALATFMLMLDLTVVNVALPDIRSSFDSSFSDLQWFLDAYALGLATILLAAGALADRIGRRIVFQSGLIVFTVASLICGLAPNGVTLIGARFLQGLGGAVLFAVGPALLGHEFRGKDRGKAFGVFGAVAGLAIAFGPLIGGALTEFSSWRWIFLVNIPPALVAICFCHAKVRESRDDASPSVDWVGSLSFSVALFFVVLGVMRGTPDGWISLGVTGCFVVSAFLIVVFLVVQFRRRESALFDIALLVNRTFNGLSLVTALSAFSVMPAIFFLISYVRNVLEYSPLASGVRFLPLTLLVFVAAGLCGSVVAKWQPALLIGASQLFIAAGSFAVLLVQPDSDWTALLPAMVLIGIGMGLFNPPRAALSIAVTVPAKAGMASGTNETFQQAGLAVGIAAMGALFQERVSVAFSEGPVAALLGSRAADASDAIAAGAAAEVVNSVPASIAQEVRNAATSAFVSGLHDMMMVAGSIASVAGILAFATIRRRDLDSTALA